MKNRFIKKGLTSLKRGAFVAGALAAGFLLAGVDPVDAAPKKGGKLRIAILADIGGFDSLKIPITGRQRAFVMQAIHENLFDMDPETFKIIPRTGLKAEASDDFKRWRVTLRQGVKYSNGEEMTSADYKAHFDRLLNSKKFGNRFRGTLGPRLDHVEAPSKYVVDFVFSEPSPGWETIMTLNDLVWWVRPKSYLDANKDKKTFNNNTVGAGPYMLKTWRRSSSIVLAKNPNYWDKANQHVDEIHLQIINQQLSRMQALQAGQMDFLWLPPALALVAKKDKRLRHVTGPSFFAGLGIGFNQGKPPFDDIRVRKALVHSLDRDLIGSVITKVPEKAPTHMYSAEHPWACKGIEFPKYDVAKAKALLKEYGKPIKTTLNIVALRDLIRVGEAYQAYWKEAGIEVAVKPGGRGPKWGRAVASGKFDFWWHNYQANNDPSLVGMIFHSKSRANLMKINDPEIDAAIAKVKAARGRTDRHKASCDFQRLLVKQVRILPWEQRGVTVVFQPYVKNVIKPLSIFPKYQRVWLDK
jgi:peptide/nickel transport system substrate-binding protein